jgi:glycine cleavage system T protein (aminomethyltransferase)
MCATTTKAESASLQHTALYSLHQSLDAKIVPFTGYALPVQYSDGIKAEHLHTRTHAGLFDVSHMGQISIQGEAVQKSFEALVTGDLTALQDYQQRYTLLTNPDGGIIDDLMVTKMPDGLFVVVNAACKDGDYQHIKKVLGSGYQVEMLNDRALLALQGPDASAVLASHNSDIAQLAFMNAGRFEIDGIDCIINRCGYTGEDGFEISVNNSDAEGLAKLLLEHDEVKPVGLGARDSLRLEAGLCLYGHDIDETTTPIEANLRWAVAMKYRNESAEANFPGADKILHQAKEGTEKLLVGLKPEGKMPIREGSLILNQENVEVGHVSSGGFGPSIGGPVALGYVSSEYAAVGTELHVEIRNRSHTMRVADLPFVLHRYYKP